MTAQSCRTCSMSGSVFERKGVSVERLKTLIAIDEAGGITAAAGGNAVRQSQFSRQLKELVPIKCR